MLNLIGKKFTDGIRQYEIFDIVTIAEKEYYRVKNHTDNKDNELFTIENLNIYLSNQEELSSKYESRQLRKKVWEKEIQEERKKKEELEKKLNEDYGFCENKTLLQKGKTLKILNKEIRYNNEIITRKERIVNILTTCNNCYTDEYLNTNRYSEHKINLEYKKLTDKIEYRLYFQEGDDEYFINLTKTEYQFSEYLIKNKILNT